MNTIQLIICYPAGNINGIVVSEIERSAQPYIAEEIIQAYNKNKSNNFQIEQVGFIEKPSDSRAVARLQMSGGEFSGNAALCLSEIVLEKDTSKFIEVSGSSHILSAKKYPNGTVSCEMPIPETYTTQYSIEKLPMIQLDGITHIIVRSMDTISEAEQRAFALQIITRNNLLESPATGILFTEPFDEYTKMIPYIYFRKGQRYELVKETSCGSGSVAVALYAFFTQKRQSPEQRILQPSGCKLSVTVEYSNAKLSCYLSGTVKILYRNTYPIVYNL